MKICISWKVYGEERVVRIMAKVLFKVQLQIGIHGEGGGGARGARNDLLNFLASMYNTHIL